MGVDVGVGWGGVGGSHPCVRYKLQLRLGAVGNSEQVSEGEKGKKGKETVHASFLKVGKIYLRAISQALGCKILVLGKSLG